MSDQPKMSRQERQEELRRLLNSPDGERKVETIFREAMGIPLGFQGPIGAKRIETILSKEYPNES